MPIIIAQTEMAVEVRWSNNTKKKRTIIVACEEEYTDKICKVSIPFIAYIPCKR